MSMIFSILVFINEVNAFFKSQKQLPVPNEVHNLLFYIQRDPDSNTVCYTLNVNENGQFNEKEPVNIFWVRYAEGGNRKELNYLQRKFGYGLKIKANGINQFEIRPVAYPKRALILKRNKENKFQVHTSINRRDCILKNVFIRIDGGSAVSPNVKYIELHGTDSVTGETVMEKVMIS
ncbi:DUF4833 domain-containing protein [Dyadobacter frigoris]|uniref:DUF4833 domain-containing protein n=1 Tax=Dyadobacter frigoris TaxID=2576211 RepID=UPI002555254E|nr:DUF4833 domain-containing protein [Dyadobacter frigoris]